MAEETEEIVLRSALVRDSYTYFDWIYPYLFYFDFNENQRFFGKAFEDESGRYDCLSRQANTHCTATS